MNNDYYSKLPNILLVPEKDKDTNEIITKSIYKNINDDRLILVFDYLYTNTNREGITIFSINDIVTTYGFKIDNHKGRINSKIKEIIFKLSLLDYIIIDFDIFNINNNELLKCKINDNVIKYDSNFTMLLRNELNIILSCNDLDKLILLKLFCYLKIRMYKRIENKDIQLIGGKAEVCYPSYEVICEEIGISEAITNKYINKLKELKLIVFDNAGVYYHPNNKENKRESANTYALYKENGSHEIELKESIKFYKKQMKEKGYIFISKDKRQYKNNNRKLNGELGALTKLKNKGTATKEQLKRIEEIRNIIQENKNNK